jgi:hypothetical protein
MSQSILPGLFRRSFKKLLSGCLGSYDPLAKPARIGDATCSRERTCRSTQDFDPTEANTNCLTPTLVSTRHRRIKVSAGASINAAATLF